MGIQNMGASLRDRAGGLTPRALLRGLGLTALIPCATACSRSVFVWTVGDVFGLTILGLVFAGYLIVFGIYGLKKLWAHIKRLVGRV